MKNKKQYTSLILVGILVGLVVIFSGWIADKTSAKNPDYYFSINKNIGIFGKVYEEITRRYVETIDPEKFMQAGIDGMLSTLDPYTIFIEKEANEELQIMTRGKYGGVGMRISKRDGWPTVIEPPFDGTPSQKAGIREGDRIIEVDGMVTKDLTISETANRLRGKPGTEVHVKIQRLGRKNGKETLEFRLIRAEIKVEEITYSGLIKDDIGYIRLAHFSRDVGKQLHDAIVGLKRQGMKSLILDLRGNPGGLLESAVSVADNFIEKNKVIVSTKGKYSEAQKDYKAETDPIWGKEPLVVLVDTTSASASEIVAGAIQDLDRGIVVGSPTFGKGLVQTVVPISKETALKITTMKYYIPSGRLIQKPNVYHDPSVLLSSSNLTQDSSKIYKTASGRIVHGNGGIYPDVKVEPLLLPVNVRHMIMQSMFFNFSLEYTAEHADLQRDFEITEEIINNFKQFLKEKDFKYQTIDEKELEDLEKVAQENGYDDTIKPALNEIRNVIEVKKNNEFKQSIDFITWYIKAEIAGKLWGTSAKVEAGFSISPEIKKALEILSNKEQYFTVLTNG